MGHVILTCMWQISRTVSSLKASSMQILLWLFDDRSRRLDRPGAYSCESDLAVKANKTKWMLVSIPHTSFYHSLHEN